MSDQPGTGVEEVSFTIDGKELTARKGELIIAAAERHGVYIPRFCYHPRMRSVGMCRMCLVEVDTGRGPALQPSCMLEVSPGMVVDTQSRVAQKAQDGVIEFLLINHPLDCPVCDKGGECPLQDQTISYGPGESRFVEEKRHYEKPIPISDVVLLDRERCILCDRCTRFAKEVAGDPFITFQDRGSQTQVNTFPDHPFASYFSGNTVQICPVGALTAEPYRFRARPWDLEQSESTCQSCALGCRVDIQTSRDRVLRYQGVDIDEVNWGWLCDKGRFDFESISHEERLGDPLLRQGDVFVDTTWGEALAAASESIRSSLGAHGPGAIGVIGGARFTNEDAYAWAKLAKGVIGTDNVDCQLGDGLPAEAVLGVPRATIDEVCSSGGTVLVIGTDLKEELPVLFLRLRDAVVSHDVTVIEVSSRSTSLGPLAALSLHPRPGEIARVATALAGGADGNEVGGVGAADLARAAALLAIANGPVKVVVGRGSVAEHESFTVDAIAALLEGLDDVRFLSALRRANVHGALDMGLAPGVLPGRVSLDDGRSSFEELWSTLPAARGLDTLAMLQAAIDGEIDVLVLLGADLFDLPDRDLATRALASTTVIALDLFETPTTALADLVLPVAGYAECEGTTTNIEGRLSTLARRVNPPGTARAPWTIAAELALRLGGDLGVDSVRSIWDEVATYAPAHQGISHLVLRSPLAAGGIVAPIEDPERYLAGLSTPVMIGAAAGDEGPSTEPEPRLGDESALPPTLTFVAPTATEVPPVDSYSLRLVAIRELYDDGTLVHHSPSLAHLARGPVVRVNSYDFDRLGVAAGDVVRVSSAQVSFDVPVERDDGVPRGCAAMVFNQPEVAVASLIDSSSVVTDVRVETLEEGG